MCFGCENQGTCFWCQIHDRKQFYRAVQNNMCVDIDRQIVWDDEAVLFAGVDPTGLHLIELFVGQMHAKLNLMGYDHFLPYCLGNLIPSFPTWISYLRFYSHPGFGLSLETSWSGMDTFLTTFFAGRLPFDFLPFDTTRPSWSMESSKLDISLKRLELQVSIDDWEWTRKRGLERLTLGIFCYWVETKVCLSVSSYPFIHYSVTRHKGCVLAVKTKEHVSDIKFMTENNFTELYKKKKQTD